MKETWRDTAGSSQQPTCGVKTKLSGKTSLKKWKLKMWKPSFNARLSSKTGSWRCENEAFVSARRPSKSESWRSENEAFVQDVPQKVKGEDVKAKLSCKTSLKKWKLKIWKRRFRARRSSKSEGWRCESEAFVQYVPQKEDGKNEAVALDAPHRLTDWKLRMWNKRSFRARRSSKTEIWRCENEAFVRDVSQKLEVEDVKTTLSCDINCCDFICRDIHSCDTHCCDIHCCDIHCCDIHYCDVHWHDIHWCDIHCCDIVVVTIIAVTSLAVTFMAGTSIAVTSIAVPIFAVASIAATINGVTSIAVTSIAVTSTAVDFQRSVSRKYRLLSFLWSTTGHSQAANQSYHNLGRTAGGAEILLQSSKDHANCADCADNAHGWAAVVNLKFSHQWQPLWFWIHFRQGTRVVVNASSIQHVWKSRELTSIRCRPSCTGICVFSQFWKPLV